MTELINILLALIIAIIFAAGEIAVTLYATEKTTEQLKKHNDESERRILAALKKLEDSQNGSQTPTNK